MIVERSHLDPVLNERLHHRIDLVTSEHEVAHHHRLVAHRLECQPGAEGEAGLDLDTVEPDFQIRARQADPIDTAGLDRTLSAESLSDRLPIRFGRSRSRDGKSEQRSETCDPHRRVLLIAPKSFCPLVGFFNRVCHCALRGAGFCSTPSSGSLPSLRSWTLLPDAHTP